jgi:hypothetical protein
MSSTASAVQCASRVRLAMPRRDERAEASLIRQEYLKRVRSPLPSV